MEYIKQNKIWLGILVAIVVVLGFIVVRNTNNNNLAAVGTLDSELVTVRFGDLPVVHALPFYVALEKGYFEKAGINAERIKLDSPNLIIDALLSGKIDITSPSGAMGIAGVASVKKPGSLQIYMATGGDEVVANDSLLVKTDSEINSIDDLKSGMSIGILPGIQWRTITKHLLVSYGLEVDKDITLVELAPGLQAPALASGQIDVLLAIEPMATIVKVKNIGREIVSAPTTVIANPFYPGAGIVSSKFVQENPEIMEKIIIVFERSLEDIREDPEGVREYFRGYTPLDDSIIPEAPILKFVLSKDFTEKDIEVIEAFHRIFSTYGVVETPIQTRDILYKSN